MWSEPKIMLKYYIIIAICTITSANKCCDGVNVLEQKKCPNGQPLKLNCTHKYILNTDFDYEEPFNIDANGYLLHTTNDDETESFEPSKYCITKLDAHKEEVVIVCFEDHDIEETKWYGFRAIGGFISVAFLIATITVYILVPTLRDLQGKCIMHALGALTLSFLNLGIIQLADSLTENLCLFYAFFNYVTFMCTFFWLNVTSFHVCKTVVFPNILGTEKQWYLIYLLYGYGAPLCMLVVLLITHHVEGDHLKPAIGISRCWFNGMPETWAYFYGPIAVLLSINLALFIWTIIKLTQQSKLESETKLKSLRYKVGLYSKLFLIMGLLWFFEVISAALANVHRVLDIIWIITDYVNLLQGILIFFLLVVFRKRALRGLANLEICGLRLPNAWKTLEDQESFEAEGTTNLSNNQMNQYTP